MTKPPSRPKSKRAKFADAKFIASRIEQLLYRGHALAISKDISVFYIRRGRLDQSFCIGFGHLTGDGTYRERTGFKTLYAALKFLDTPAGRKLLKGRGK